MNDKYVMEGYQPVIGLEVHAQLTTASKIFCGCKVESGAPPNSLTCPVCLGLPGSLPVLNKRAVEFAIRMILAVGGQVHLRSVFARKNYFYPDLPKGYQISQFESPIGDGGVIVFRSETAGRLKSVHLKRIHLEEDAGKSIHPEGRGDTTKIDLNRCGVPLIEIVSEPEIFSPHDAYAFLVKLKQILRYLEICTGDMEKGHLRCDANVSVRPVGTNALGVKTEVKNMNSFKWVERALNYEIERQIGTLKSGGVIEQTTMLWDEKRQLVEPMRSKEESHDYRYFSEPDLVNLLIDRKWLDSIICDLPEMPDVRAQRLVDDYTIPEYDARVLTESKELADYYETVMKDFDDGKIASNWIMTEVLKIINDKNIDISEFQISPQMIGELLRSIKTGIISGRMAKEVFEEMVLGSKSAGEIIKERGLTLITDEEQLGGTIDSLIKNNMGFIEKNIANRKRIFGHIVGQVMKQTKGKADPRLVNRILQEKLDELAR